MDRPTFRNVWRGGEERAERHRKKRREKAKPLEVELELVGEFSREDMSMSSLEMGKKRIWPFRKMLNTKRV